MRCVVFGGGGFIGSWVVDALLQHGHAVRVFERPGVAAYRTFQPHEKLDWYTGDWLCESTVLESVASTDLVVHLISTTLPKSSNEDPIYDVQSNLTGSLRILNAMVSHKVPRLVFISSGGTVYGVPKYEPIDESHPTDPLVSYGIVKLAIEKYLLMYEHLHGITPIILRVSNPFGPRQRIGAAQGAVGVFLRRALSKQPIEIWGDGRVTRDYVYISDVASAVLEGIAYSGKHRVFNIGSGLGTSLNDLITELETVLNCAVARQYLPGRGFDVPSNVLNNALARKELGWAPRISLRDGLSLTAQHLVRSPHDKS